MIGAIRNAMLARRGPLWTPAQISTVLWYDAADTNTITQSGGLVSQWADKSGNAKHATQSNNTYKPQFVTNQLNGYGVIRCDGGDDYLTIAQSINGWTGFTGIMIGRGLNGKFAIWCCYDGAKGLILAPGYRLGGRPGGDATYFNAVVPSVDKANWHMIVGTYDLVNMQAYGDGVAGTPTALSHTSISAPSYCAIGCDYLAPAEFENSEYAEIIIMSSVVSTTTRQRLEGYLAHKWGLTANLPSDHPYKNSPPYV